MSYINGNQHLKDNCHYTYIFLQFVKSTYAKFANQSQADKHPMVTKGIQITFGGQQKVYKIVL